MARPRRGRRAHGRFALTSLRIIGAGRAGLSFAGALRPVGYQVEVVPREAATTDVLRRAADNVEGVLIATPDAAIASVAALIEPGDAVIMHCSGATGLTALAPHVRQASIHPLMALPSPEVGEARLADAGWFAVAGDGAAGEFARKIVDDLGGRSFAVPDDKRALYHATAAVSANHLVALLGQVERLAELAGVPTQAFFDLARGSFDDVVASSARAALTGPAARNDEATLVAHIAALPENERALYDALMRAAQRLATD